MARARLAVVMKFLANEDDDADDSAETFTKWAERVRQGLDQPWFTAVLPRKVRWWRLVELESTSADWIRGAYRR